VNIFHLGGEIGTAPRDYPSTAVPNSVLVPGQNWKLHLSSSPWLGIQALGNWDLKIQWKLGF